MIEGVYYLFVFMVVSDGMFIGMFCLGEKCSELFYSVEDCEFFEVVVVLVLLSLENCWMVLL